MVVVVPALACGNHGNDPVVLAMFFGVVVAVAEHVRQAVHAPRNVPHKHRSQHNTPHKNARGEKCRARDICPK